MHHQKYISPIAELEKGRRITSKTPNGSAVARLSVARMGGHTSANAVAIAREARAHLTSRVRLLVASTFAWDKRRDISASA